MSESVKNGRMPETFNLRLFRRDVKPLWEDPANVNGGTWVVRLPTASTAQEAHAVWTELTLAAIGEQLPFASAVVRVRVLVISRLLAAVLRMTCVKSWL